MQTNIVPCSNCRLFFVLFYSFHSRTVPGASGTAGFNAKTTAGTDPTANNWRSQPLTGRNQWMWTEPSIRSAARFNRTVLLVYLCVCVCVVLLPVGHWIKNAGFSQRPVCCLCSGLLGSAPDPESQRGRCYWKWSKRHPSGIRCVNNNHHRIILTPDG